MNIHRLYAPCLWAGCVRSAAPVGHSGTAGSRVSVFACQRPRLHWWQSSFPCLGFAAWPPEQQTTSQETHLGPLRGAYVSVQSEQVSEYGEYGFWRWRCWIINGHWYKGLIIPLDLVPYLAFLILVGYLEEIANANSKCPNIPFMFWFSLFLLFISSLKQTLKTDD